MIDVELNDRLTVHTEGDAGPYLMVPIQQLAQVEAVLHNAHITYSLSRDVVQVDGHDADALIDFGRRADPARIQTILDNH